MRRRARVGRERGSEAIEAAIGVPAFMLFIALIISAGRVAIAHQGIESAAAEAARSASIARTQAQAQTDAYAGAERSLADQGLQCNPQVAADTTGFATPPGTPATVSATVTCSVNLRDVAMPGMPGTITITKTMSSPLDTYREH